MRATARSGGCQVQGHDLQYRKLAQGVDRSGGPDACWEWTGARNSAGYGRAWHNGQKSYAHRIAWEEANGPVPAGQDVCHRCDNPPCCNPAHLWLGTARENLRDAAVKGRLGGWADGRMGEAHPSHKLTWAAVREIRAKHAAGQSQHSLAREHGVSQPAIHFIITGQTWPEPAADNRQTVAPLEFVDARERDALLRMFVR